MATRPSLLGHSHDSVLRAWNGSPHEQQIPLRVYLHHSEPELRVSRGAHVTWHPLSFNNSRRVGAWADRAGLPMPGIAVSRRPATEPVPMDDTLKAATLRGARYLHQLARREDVHLHLRPRGRHLSVDAEPPEHLRGRLESSLLRMPQHSLTGPLGSAGSKSELDSTILDLHHAARTGFDHRHGDGGA